MKAEQTSDIRYRVEVECLDFDPMTGLPLRENAAIEHAHYILSELPFMDRLEARIAGELELTSVKLWKKEAHYDWLLMCQWTFDAASIAKRVTERKEAAEKLGAWRAGAQPGESASLADILGSAAAFVCCYQGCEQRATHIAEHEDHTRTCNDHAEILKPWIEGCELKVLARPGCCTPELCATCGPDCAGRLATREVL